MPCLGQVGARILEGAHCSSMKLSSLPFKIESELVRAFYRLMGWRPGSRPYISGDGFRELAQWKYEPDTSPDFDPSVILPGSIGYCDGWKLREFLVRFGAFLPPGVRLISHNADPNVTSEIGALLPPGVVLYSTNCLINDPSVVAIPIGLENARLHYNGVVRDFEKLRKHDSAKKPRILVAFTVGTNRGVREPALRTLEALKTVDSLARTNSRTYREIASRYAFIASPPGNGEDCHRTWEAVYLKAIPIVLRSPMTEAFVKRGLPLWQVDSYNQVASLDEAALSDKYNQLANGFHSPWLWMETWADLVRDFQT